MSEQATRFRLGIFVLLSLILLAVMVILFGGLPGFFKASNRYTLEFDSAEGVGAGTPVRRAGVKIGEVEELNLNEATGKVLVTIRVDAEYKLRKNDEPTLVQGFLGSDSSIDFISAEPEEGKTPDRTPVQPGSTVEGKTLADAKTVVQKASQLVNPAQEALIDIRKTLKRLEKMAPVIEEALKDFSEVARDAKKGLPEVKETNEEFLKLAKAANELMPALKTTAKDFQELAKKANESFPEFTKTNKDLQKLIQSADDSIPELKQTNKDIQKLVKSVDDSIPDIKRTNTELQKLVKSTNKAFPEFEKSNLELQKTLIQWERVGERTNILLQSNEQRIKSVLEKFEKTLTNVEELLNEENRKNINKIIANSRKASEKFDSIAENTDKMLKDIRPTMEQARSVIARADEVFKDLKQITGPLAKKSETILTNLDKASVELNNAFADMRMLLSAVSRKDGTVQKLLTDPTLYNRLDQTLCLVTKIMPRLDNVLRDVEIFADRIARHPELLGIRGAVNPSSGLKNLPKRPLYPTGP